MIKIKNNTGSNIQFEEIVFQPGLNWIERDRFRFVIESNPQAYRRFKTFITQEKLEILEK